VTFGLGETPDDKRLFPTEDNPTFAEVNAKLKELKIDGEVQTDSTRPGNPIVTLRLFDSRLSSNVVLSLVRQMPSLEVLNLRRGLVDDEFVEGLGELKIRFLSLQATRITDHGLRHLARLPSLTELVLTETDISNEGLVHLRSLSNPRSIMLDSTRVTSDGVTRLRQSLPDCSL